MPWRVVLAVKPNQLDNLEILTGEMVESARHETRCLSNQRFVSADGIYLPVYERYSNSATALVHLTLFFGSSVKIVGESWFR